jgi:hypothetical protein
MNNIKLNTSNIPHKDGNKDNTPALQKLKILAVEHKRMKYPNLPDHAIPITKYKDNTANGLTRCVIDFLKFNGQQAERISTTGRYIDNRRTITDVIGYKKVIGSGKWIPTSGKKGSADISATIYGISVKIEIKTTDRQSPAQKKYQQQVERAGGIYLIVRRFEDFYKWFQALEKGGEE